VTKTIDDSTIRKGSGNVFADLGFSPGEARNLHMRSQIMMVLRKLIEKEGLTQVQAARRFQVSQPRISDLMRGKISRFSLDTLVTMLTEVGMDVDLRIRAKPRRVA
jgi:predicted XRE-type DNA-binding protein